MNRFSSDVNNEFNEWLQAHPQASEYEKVSEYNNVVNRLYNNLESYEKKLIDDYINEIVNNSTDINQCFILREFIH